MEVASLVVWSMVLVTFAYCFDAVKDTLSHKFDRSIFSLPFFHQNYWNPNLSHLNKWKVIDGRVVKKTNGERVERFFLSSTVLVWTTDAWHLFDTLELLCFQLIASICLSSPLGIHPLLILLGIKAIRMIPFNLLYKVLFLK